MMRAGKVVLIGCCMVAALWISSTITTGADEDQHMAAQPLVPDVVTATAEEATEAPTGFEDVSNGLTDQEIFEHDRTVFAEQETREDGLGPVYNAMSCGECRRNPIIGGNSQITELRAGYFDGRTFSEHPGGSLIHDRAIDPAVQESMLQGYNVRALRAAVSLLGAGFIEAIDSHTLLTIARSQPALGNKIIHLFSDFLLHDVGTGDGIVQNGGLSTRNKLRTTPLWGLRTRSRFLHDHRALTLQEAISHHAGEASDVISTYRALPRTQQDLLLTFLRSL